MDISFTVFDILMHKARKLLVFPTPPCLTPPLRETRQNCWMKLPWQKLEGCGYTMVKIAWL